MPVASVERSTEVPEAAASLHSLSPNPWRRISINQIEDLKDAVRGAGLDAVQMTRGAMSGGLAFAEHRGVLFSSGLINGTVSLRGALSEDRITLGIGLRMTPGSWHWMIPVESAVVGLFREGDEHDSFYHPGSLYVAVTLSRDQLEIEAEKAGIQLDPVALQGTGVHPRQLDRRMNVWLGDGMARVHEGAEDMEATSLCDALLNALMSHFGKPPALRSFTPRRRHARLVARARAYIHDNLHEPISVDAVAEAAMTSRRTLYRAFVETMGEPPQTYVRRLRLHRIRRDLASEDEVRCTIALIANQWGIGELGRLSGRYRELFGELPSETMARRRASLPMTLARSA